MHITYEKYITYINDEYANDAGVLQHKYRDDHGELVMWLKDEFGAHYLYVKIEIKLRDMT